MDQTLLFFWKTLYTPRELQMYYENIFLVCLVEFSVQVLNVVSARLSFHGQLTSIWICVDIIALNGLKFMKEICTHEVNIENRRSNTRLVMN